MFNGVIFPILFCVSANFPQSCSSYKVVIFVPTISNSQMVFNYRLGDLIASAGHDVTMYRPQYNPDALKGSSNLSKEIRITAYNNAEDYRQLLNVMGPHVFGEDSFNIGLAGKWMKFMLDACEAQISNRDLMAQLKQEQFDIALVHMYDFCPMGIVKSIGIPTQIWTSSAVLTDYMAWILGVPTPTSYVPNIISAMGDRMTYVERVKNFLGMCLLLPFTDYYVATPETELFRQYFGKDFPYLPNLAAKSPLVFVNSVEFFDFPRPILHKVQYVGGIGMSEPKKLDKFWQHLMDTSLDGVVLMSMGSVVNSSQMPHQMKLSFLGAFQKFPTFTFVWKYEADDLEEAKKCKNVRLFSWVPQRDVFGHPKIRAFISHGGYNSFQEAAFAGVPILSVPLFADQYANMRKVEKHGIGLGMDKLKITEDYVTQKLKTLLEDDRYLTQSKRMAGMLKKRPINSDDLVVKWIDFLGEYKDLPNLQPIGTDLPLYQYFSMDVIAGLIAGMIVAVYFVYRILLCYYYACCPQKLKKKKRD